MAKVKYYAKENSSIGTHSFYAARSPTARSRLTFELSRQTESWRDDLRDVRCKMEDVRGLTGVGSLVFEHELHELNEL